MDDSPLRAYIPRRSLRGFISSGRVHTLHMEFADLFFICGGASTGAAADKCSTKLGASDKIGSAFASRCSQGASRCHDRSWPHFHLPKLFKDS